MRSIKPRYFKSAYQIFRAQGIRKLMNISFEYFSSDPNKSIKNFIISNSKNFRIFIDIGAAIGDITTSVAPNFSKCLAFEPAKNNYEKLITNIKKINLDNIMSYNCALGDNKESKTFYLSEINIFDNRFDISKNPNEEIGKFHSQEVEVNTLDNILQELDIHERSLIKMDVQGSEYSVMRGAKNLLENDCLIITEFWPWGMKLSNTKAEEYVKFMKSLGYNFFDFNKNPVDEKYLEKICQVGKEKKYVWEDFVLAKEL